jgi:hypothetical protein
VVCLQPAAALGGVGAEHHRLAAPAVALEHELPRLAVGTAAPIRSAGVLRAASAPRLAELGAPRNGADVQGANATEVGVAVGHVEHATEGSWAALRA